jgi:hypothetical protein
MNFIEKLIAHIKGNYTCRILTEREYYYLMFGCETDDDISLIKSMTLDECNYYLDCCWYLGLENTTKYQFTFMKNYRKFGLPFCSNAQYVNTEEEFQKENRNMSVSDHAADRIRNHPIISKRQLTGNCNVSQCEISFRCAEVHSTYKPPCASCNQQRIDPEATRAVMVNEILDYRKKHSAVYGDAMTYIDEGKYLEEIASRGEQK